MEVRSRNAVRFYISSRSDGPGNKISVTVNAEHLTGERVRVVFLDDNEDLRELMEILLETELHVKCMSLSHVADLHRHAQEVLHASLAILDINLGPGEPDGVDAFDWLMKQGFAGKVLFLTGHARSNPRVALAGEKGVDVYEKPIPPDKLVAAIRKALDGKS
jgi:DNA-binding NtrC family response regulator